VTVTTLARTHVVYGAQKADGFTVSAGSFTINGTVITTTATDTLDNVALLINNTGFPPGEEVSANVIDNRLSLQTKLTGVAATIYGTSAGSPPFTIPGDDPNSILSTELGLIDGGGEFINVAQTSADAALTINGVPLTQSGNILDSVIEHVTFNIFSTGTAAITITHDTEQVKKAITDLVDLYNETRDLIKRVRDAKIDEDENFGLFATDPLIRTIFTEIRSQITGSVTMVSGDWSGSLTSSVASAGATSLTISGFSPDTGTLKNGDLFTIPGHSKPYRVQSDTSIVAGSATVGFFPPLTGDATLGDTIRPFVNTLEKIGVGVRTDTFSGVEGIIGITDSALLDAVLLSDIDQVKKLFTRGDLATGRTGVATRLYNWIDRQVKISVFINKTRAIDDITIPGLEKKNVNIDDQVIRLQRQLENKRQSLIRKFAEMENSISKSQSLGAAIGSIGGGGGK